MAAVETNRATVVALYAEVRRIKARLIDEVPKLKKLAQRKVCFDFSSPFSVFVVIESVEIHVFSILDIIERTKEKVWMKSITK